MYSAVELDRILFVFAKLHPEVAYVQGMNELVAPLFYVICQQVRRNYHHSGECRYI